jgi:hypothetical protein
MEVFGFEFILVYYKIMGHCKISYTMEENQLLFLKVMETNNISTFDPENENNMKFNNLIDTQF